MFKQISFMLLVGVLLIPRWSRAADQMEALASEAVSSNPKITSMERQVAALEARADAVQRWMDPIFAVEYSNVPWNTWSLGDSPMSGVQFKLSQTFPYPGKNDRRKATALADAAARELERDELTLQLTAALKRNYLALTLVRQLRGLTMEHIASIDKLLMRVRLRYEVGRGNQKDVLRLALLKTKLEDELEDFDRQDRDLTASINAALHRDPRGPIATPDQSQLVPQERSLDDLLELAREHRPLLALFKQRAEASKLAATQVDWDNRPDFTLWLGYRIRAEAGMDDGSDFMSIGAAIPIPLDYSGATDAKKTQHLEMASASDANRLASLDEIAAQIERSLATWNRAFSKEETYRTALVPQARKTRDAALLAYETDRADFFAIYRAELDLIEFERTIRVSRITMAQMKVAVEALIGAELEPGLERGEEADVTR